MVTDTIQNSRQFAEAQSGLRDPATSEVEWHRLAEKPEYWETPAFKLSPEVRLGIPVQARLRRDSRQVIYYGSTLFDVWCYRLNQMQVACLSLFDGQRTLRQVAQEMARLSDCDLAAADLKVRAFARFLGFGSQPALVEVASNGTPPTKTFDVSQYLLPESFITSRLDRPTSLMMMPTDKCLTDCVYCYACRRPIPRSELLSVKRLKELTDEAAKMGVVNINLDGGDLFARPEWPDILAHIIDSSVEPAISTKAYISREMAQQLRRIGLKWLQIGLDAPGEMADQLTRRPGYFKRTLESIHNLNEAGVSVRTNTIIVRETLHMLPELIDLLVTLPLRDMKFAPAFRSLFRDTAHLVLPAEEKAQMTQMMQDAQRKYPDKALNWEARADVNDLSEEERQKRFRERPLCSSGRTQIIICPDGKVVTCEQSPQDETYLCGDVTTQSIQEVWDSPELRRWYRPAIEQYKDTICEECDHFVDCMHYYGHCWLQAVKRYGTRFAPHPDCPKAPLSKERWE